MTPARLEQTAAGRYRLSGDLSFETVPQLVLEGQRLFQPGAATILDLAAVGRSDSAGLALLLSWLRAARRQDVRLTFHAVPAQLRGLAQVGGVEQILPLDQA